MSDDDLIRRGDVQRLTLRTVCEEPRRMVLSWMDCSCRGCAGRKEFVEAVDSLPSSTVVATLRAEVARLTRERDEERETSAARGRLLDDHRADCAWRLRAETAEARVAELEAALREIADWGCNLDPIAPCFKRDDGGKCLPCIARAALAPKEPDRE